MSEIHLEIIHGDCLDIMKKFPDNHFTNIITDPPYGLGFMGKKWDSNTPGFTYWKHALRICKPGAIIAVFGGTRTHHRLMCDIEDSGWEIRDVIMWLYGSGFPKSHNHFGLEGYGTALKPAYEPIILAMKPLEGTFAENADKWGLAGINIDKCRIGTDDTRSKCSLTALGQGSGWNDHKNKEVIGGSQSGRWPANIILDEEAGKMLDEQTGILKSGSGDKHSKTQIGKTFSGLKPISGIKDYQADSGGASRFFYSAKASSKERNQGLEGMPLKQTIGGGGINNDENNVCGAYGSIKALAKNHHPTVKPIALMKYIIKLLAPPQNALILDPFAGSGTTILAAKELGISSIGIEKEEEYYEIARKRVA